jgi:hypothetical protein
MAEVKAEPASPGKPGSGLNKGKGSAGNMDKNMNTNSIMDSDFQMADWVNDPSLLDKMGRGMHMDNSNLSDPVKTIEVCCVQVYKQGRWEN